MYCCDRHLWLGQRSWFQNFFSLTAGSFLGENLPFSVKTSGEKYAPLKYPHFHNLWATRNRYEDFYGDYGNFWSKPTFFDTSIRFLTFRRSRSTLRIQTITRKCRFLTKIFSKSQLCSDMDIFVQRTMQLLRCSLGYLAYLQRP